MSSKVKQHYVPQFYLRNFSRDKKSIYCFDKVNVKSDSQGIRNVAQEKYFYEFESLYLEDDFASLETEVSKYINNIVRIKKYKILNNLKQRSKLALFMAAQLIRTLERRQLVELQVKALKNHFIETDVMNDTLSSFFDKFLQDASIKESHLKLIQEMLPHLVKRFFFKKWVLLIDKTDVGFLTSDNPIVMYNTHNLEGLDNENNHVFFPLSPQLCICLLDPSNYKNFKAKTQYSSEEIKRNILKANGYKITNVKEVGCINALQAKYSTRHIFSQSNDFDEIKKLIDEGEVLSGEDIVKLKSSTSHVAGSEYLFKMEEYPFYRDNNYFI